MRTLSKLHHYIFKRFIYVYDAGFFGLVYSIKAMIAVCISAAICFSLLGPNVLIWSVLMAIHVFFLNGFRSNKDMDWKYLVLFVLFVCALIPLFGNWDDSLWLVLPSMLIAFCIGASEAYDNDLPKVITLALISALMANIYADSHPEISLWQCIFAAIIGGGVSIAVRLFISFGQYGKFIQTQFVAMLFELSTMCENLGGKDYELIKLQTLNHISLLKAKLTSQSAKIKDTHLIKNHKRALFYLHKLESMCYAIDLLHSHFLPSHKLSSSLKQVQQEMINNLHELSHIFYGRKPILKKQILHQLLKNESDSPHLDSLKIFYSKLESFTRISHQESLAFVENTTSKSLHEILTSLKNNPDPLLYGIRFSGAIGMAMFFAQFFQINHGAWIALGVVSMMHPNVNTIKTLGKDSIIGSLVGVIVGFIIVFLFWDTPLFYGIFIANLFLVIYFKSYPFMLWSMVLMLELVLMFALVGIDSSGENFLDLIIYRFSDILIGFCIAFFTSKILYPKYSIDELIPKLKLYLENLRSCIQDPAVSHTTLLESQNRIVRSLNELIILTKQSKNEKKKKLSNEAKSYDELIDNLLHLKECHILLWEKLDKQTKENTLFINDLNAIKTRYDMLCAMIETKPFYFKTDEDERFLLKDSAIYPLIKDIFNAQNQVYLFLQQKLGRS